MDVNGGVLYTEVPVPPLGTIYNWTFSFGPGVEFPLGDRLRLLAGGEYHHLSNAKGRSSPHNESQNELRLWVSLGIIW